MQGRIKDIIPSGRGCVVLLDTASGPEEVEKLRDKPLEITAVKKRRSLDANALLWACIGDIAQALRADKWDIYLLMLERYGQHLHMNVKPEALAMLKKQWREIKEVGETYYNGEKYLQILCFYGSSTYDSKQFSALLDGVISDMKEIGLTPPDSREMRRAIEWVEKRETKEREAKGH